ncbi:glycosyltransferase family 4 protein [Bacillus sp. JJ634]
MNKKVLFCATKDIHFESFHLPYFKWFKEQGYEVHTVAADDLKLPFVDRKYTIPIQRSPFKRANLTAYKQLQAIVEDNHYDIIHCHTPMGGVLARLAARKVRKGKTKVIYTAHGFHFCKGAPLINWLIYYPIEKTLARLTDCLITINEEDFQLAQSRKFKAKTIKHVHGVGVDIERFHPVDESQKASLRAKYGFNKEDFVMFYAAEFNKNKNQQLLIRSLASIKDEIPNCKLLLAGQGPFLEYCQKLAHELNVSKMIKFLGFRKDIDALLKISDVAVASSLREGLPVNIMEAMACGLPVIASNNRGHRELIIHEENGFLAHSNDNLVFSEKIIELFHSVNLRQHLGLQSEKIVQKYSIARVSAELSVIYSGFMVEDEDEPKNKYHRAYI